MDQAFFLAINHLPHNVMFDVLAQFFSGIGQWGVIWFIIAVVLFFREEERDHWFFLPTTLAIGLGIVVSELFLKWIIARPRPTEAIGAIIRTFPGNYSFPSTHATIAWAMAFVLSREEPKFTFWFYLLATLISLSRIYLGVHYPTDVFGGALLGLGIGWIATLFSSKFHSSSRGWKHHT
jgi:undecaprenyl-diphosphatase